MSLRLTSDDARRLRAATAALLAPLAGPEPLSWWREAEARLHALFPGANAMLSLPNGTRLRNDSQTVDAAHLRMMNEMSRADPRTGFHDSSDPASAWFNRYRRAAQLELWTLAEGAGVLTAQGYDLRRNAVYHEGLAPAGFADFVCAASQNDGGEMWLTVGYTRPTARRHFDDEREVVGLLLPALQVAHHALATFGARRAALLDGLDTMGDALLIVDADGRAVHHNAALQRTLVGEPAREQVLAAMHALAAEVRALRGRPTGAAPAVPARAMATALARYALRASFAPAALWGEEGLVQVSLAAEASPLAPPPSPLVVPAALGLTARELEVAQLLARRVSNAELAAALGVSAHTARHHTERVMGKLGVNRRSEVAARLTGGER